MTKLMKPPVKAYSKHCFLGLGFHGFHQINYLEWGSADMTRRKEAIICVHGVTRNARDFDYFAGKMCDRYRVICPDVVGRGDSDHLKSPDGYDYLQYNADMNALMARVNETEVDWLGTSMGGVIGMILASLPHSPIRRLILNDIGPEVTRDSLVDIGQYIGRSPEFSSLGQAEKYLRGIYTDFAPMSDDDWTHMTKYAAKRTETGMFRLKMDAKIGDAFRNQISMFGLDMWEAWEKISCPVLVLRGKESRFFSSATAQKMLTCGPETTLVEFENTGHTPTLRNDEQVDVIDRWLAEN